MSFLVRMILGMLPVQYRDVALAVFNALESAVTGRPFQVYVTWKGRRVRFDVTVL